MKGKTQNTIMLLPIFVFGLPLLVFLFGSLLTLLLSLTTPNETDEPIIAAGKGILFVEFAIVFAFLFLMLFLFVVALYRKGNRLR